MVAKTEAVQQITTTRVPGRLMLRTLRRPRALAQRKLRHGLPRTVAHLAWINRTSTSADLKGPRRADVAPRSVEQAPCVVAQTSYSVAQTSYSVEQTPSRAVEQSAPAANSLAMRGGFWEVRFGGHAGIVEDTRGLRYIAVLIRDTHSGPIHAKELVAIVNGQSERAVELEVSDPLLDDVARGQLFARLEELASERRDATSNHDEARLAALDEEYERIASALAEGAADRRRTRRGTFNHEGEKARKAVGKAISEAIAKIASHAELSALAEHLLSSIHKGLWLSYSGGIAWSIDAKL